MSELVGPLQSIQPSRALVWLVALPLASGVLLFALAAGATRGPKPAHRGRMARFGLACIATIALGSMSATLGIAAIDLAKLLALPAADRFLYDHLLCAAHIGSVAVDIGLALDPLSAVMVLLVAALGTLVHAYEASYWAARHTVSPTREQTKPTTKPNAEANAKANAKAKGARNEPLRDGERVALPGLEAREARFFGCLHLLMAAMLFLVLADGFVGVLVGWESVGVASWLLMVLSPGGRARAESATKAFCFDRAGTFALAMGALAVFWGLGGGYLEDGTYQPDNLPRFAAIDDDAPRPSAHAHAAPNGTSANAGYDSSEAAHDDTTGVSKNKKEKSQRLVTMTARAGARVYVDDSAVPFAVSPFFRVPLSPESHRLRIAPRPPEGETELRVNELAPGTTTRTTLAPIGPTFAFREMRDELVLSDLHGREPRRDELATSPFGFGPFGYSWNLVALASGMLFIAAAIRGAQLPLAGWLSDQAVDEMPAGALCHLALMATAGVYLMARLSWLLALSPDAGGLIALAGAMSALLAALVATRQYDINRAIAHLAISQVGFMFVGLGVGAYAAATLHLVTSAFTIACLFLSAGAVVRATSPLARDESSARDLRLRRGGFRGAEGGILGRAMPLAAGSYAVACTALSSAPIPLLSGFWSRHEIFWHALRSNNVDGTLTKLVFAVAVAASAVGAFALWRTYFLLHPTRLASDAPVAGHDPAPRGAVVPAAARGVLAVLVLLSMVLGPVLACIRPWHAESACGRLAVFLSPVFAPARASFVAIGPERAQAATALVISLAFAAFALARARYGRRRPADWIEREERLPASRLLSESLFLDALYRSAFIRPGLRIRRVLTEIDDWVVEGLVSGVAGLGRVLAWLADLVDRSWVDASGHTLTEGALALGHRIGRSPAGRMRRYARGILRAVGLVAGILSVAAFGYLVWP